MNRNSLKRTQATVAGLGWMAYATGGAGHDHSGLQRPAFLRSNLRRKTICLAVRSRCRVRLGDAPPGGHAQGARRFAGRVGVSDATVPNTTTR